MCTELFLLLAITFFHVSFMVSSLPYPSLSFLKPVFSFFPLCRTLVVSASMGRVNFITPFYIGELLVLSSRVVYASAHSVEVEVKVHAENVLTGEKRISNTAHVVYVVPRDKRDAFVMPSLLADTDEERAEMERGKKRYEERKRRWETGEVPIIFCT